MLLPSALVGLLALTTTSFLPASASSTARNPLRALAIARNPLVLTQNHRVTAVSTFDLAFDYSGTRIRLSLEPNHDIIQEGAVFSYLDKHGRVVKEVGIKREEYKVFKGVSWVKSKRRSPDTPDWERVGWARITVMRDGVRPLFEGVFTVGHNHHHIQMGQSWRQTRHNLDPEIDLGREGEGDEDVMVVWRDSDIKADEEEGITELRRRNMDLACRSDELEFNTLPDHPVFAAMSKREEVEEKQFWSTPMSSLFGKRQLDNSPPGGGNGAGVNLVQSIGSTAGCPSTRKVALVGVATDCSYTGSFNSTESARQNIINQMNSASNLYESTFNISLGLANLVVTEANCPTSVQSSTPWNQACSSDVDIQERLNLFSQWRGQQKDTNSHWTLLSKCNTGSAVGLAWLGQACTQGSQSSNSSTGGVENVAGANVVVRTTTEWQVIAHETGHTFGAVHDCTAQTCGDANTVNAQQCCPLSSGTCDASERFIMNPSTAQGITHFSPCSIGNICSAMLRNSVKSTCLTNNKGVITITGQQCGNGIVEEGEDCDCGGEEGCGDNACCEPKTCKFKTGAVCDDSNEDCCKNCQLAPASFVCRASTGQCDPEEKCTGNSPNCPPDKVKEDGKSCGKGLKCASGQCTSRNQQCKSVMGSYTQGNDTYACDNSNCMLSCGSPEFGRGVCYEMQQNFLDGTDCVGGGKCQNGQCQGGSLGKEVKSWINDHKPIVIGVASAVGGLLVLSILGCIYRCIKRARARKRYAASPYVTPGYPPTGRSGRRGQAPLAQGYASPQQGYPMQQGYMPPQGYGPPQYPPPHGAPPMSPAAPGYHGSDIPQPPAPEYRRYA
ncbi:hypothetical protein GQ43DRAFT_441505 [Delitschia confertaspora ATCC 74209]|uniref:Disintegrin and metalloproteinase domain-containing protein B n=1 Tax=Delitschia confertaspora ATCC 74209 TaxID=1513339 RepID=A0A9P4JQ22_9PLEO|nr:hypothetical protein GQ43DRAFT_441505 [Delitschia confertaspora ATCC 74209]